jgi:CRISPR system Cascade subunit CasA
MSFNLIHEKWIPVRRQGGTQERIAPWEITDHLPSNPIIALDPPRPDFNGVLIQFLIGLLQTTMAPENDRAWRKALTQPPEPGQLKEIFESAAFAFDLDGNGARFMQEVELREGKLHPISYLLIDAPTEKPQEDNTDHFVKRGLFQREGLLPGMCFPCASAALFTLQLFGPQGGAGKFVGLRGGGPISTLIAGGTLWETIWLNVLLKEQLQALGKATTPSTVFDQNIFPWLKPDSLIEGITGKGVYLADVHPLHMYWAMPRRVLLECEEKTGVCVLCDKQAKSVVTHYRDSTSGIHYKDPWRHPLTPYYRNKSDMVLPQHGQSNGITYRHWLGWVQADTSSGKEPARVVLEFSRRQQWSELHEVLRSGPRLWGFGYDMAKMNARAWCEGIMPLIKVADDNRPVYDSTVAGLIRVADWINENAQIALKRVWQAKPIVNGRRIEWKFIDIKNLPKDEAKARERVLNTVGRSKAFQGASSRFWQDTEADFYLMLEQLRDALTQKLDLTPIKRRWLLRLARAGESIFDDLAEATMSGAADPKRIVLARLAMRYANSENNVFVRKLLELPIS